MLDVPLIDHHAHGILYAQPSLDEFRGLFSESPDPRQWPHVATGVTYRRAIRELAAFFGCEPAEEAVYGYRLESNRDEYASSLLRATNTELLFVDDGFPPDGEGTPWEELGRLAGCEARPVLRIESHGPEEIAGAREHGFVALKTIAAYRGGWLAHVYGHVWFDLSLTIPHVSRPAEMLRQALELAPVSKLLYASDAARTPELYYLAAKWWRQALREVLPELLEDDAEPAARRILRENALELYDLRS